MMQLCSESSRPYSTARFMYLTAYHDFQRNAKYHGYIIGVISGTCCTT